MVFRFFARTRCGAFRPTTKLYARSTPRSTSIGFIPDASSVSRSTQTGSSLKNFGVAADPSMVTAAAMTKVIPKPARSLVVRVEVFMCRSSEAGAERKRQRGAFVRAREFDAGDRVACGVQRQSKPVGGL